MLEHPYLAGLAIAQRYERMQREADTWRLFRHKRLGWVRRPAQQFHRLLCWVGRALVRLGQRLMAYGTVRTGLEPGGY